MVKSRGVQLCLFMVTLLICGLVIGVSAVTDAQPDSRIIERYGFGPQYHPTGHFISYQNFGGYAWRTDIPDRKEANPRLLVHRIYVDYGDRGEELYYSEGFWRTRYGSKKDVAPKRWFYVRLEEEKFNGSFFQYPWEVTEVPIILSVPLNKPAAPDNVMKEMMKYFNPKEIMDSMDKFDGIPDEGAPE